MTSRDHSSITAPARDSAPPLADEVDRLTAERDQLAEEIDLLGRTRAAMRRALESERREATSVEDRVIARALAQAMTDLVSLHDESGTMVYCSPSIERALGFGHAELASMRIEELLHPDDLARLTAAVPPADGEASPLVEVRIRASDGRTLWLETRVARVCDGDRELHLFVSRDISKRKAAEHALLGHRRWTDQLIEHSALGIYRADVEGRFVWVNPALVRMLGYGSASELYGVQIRDAVYETPAERERLFALANDEGTSGRFDVRWRRKDGTPIVVRMIARLVRTESGALDYCEAMVEDITQRLRTESSQRRAERMASLGRMLAGVAHELNNPLAAICGFAQLVQRTPLPPDDRAAVETIEREGQRAARIVRELLNFARHDGEVTLAPVDVAEATRYVANTQRYAMESRGIRCEVDAPDEGVWVDGDRFQLEQILVNLLVNARQAVETMLDAELSRSTATDVPPMPRASGTEPAITLRVWRDGDMAHVEVRDTGPGIAPHDLTRIWDPFFTTKPDGEGTGLGLAVVHTTIASLGGTIDAESPTEGGAIFHFALSLSTDATRTAADGGDARVAAADPSLRAADETNAALRRRDVLVVGSPMGSSRFMARYLGERGHAVVAAATLDEGVALLADAPFDVVVINLPLGRSTLVEAGTQAAARVRGVSGGVAAHLVVVVRGGGQQARLTLQREARVAVLDRPTDVEALRRLVEAS